MTVTISKPAINIREKLTEASAVVPYEQRQFHFDNLVTNGTFDTDTVWTKGTGVTIGGGVATLSSATAGAHALQQTASLTVGKVYSFEFTVSNYVSGQLAPNILGVAGTGEYVTSNGTFTQYLAVPSGSTPTGISLYVGTTFTGDIDNISVYEADPSDNKTIHTMPKGWKPLHVFEDGALQREGSAYDYTVEYDGFNYIVKETVAPVAPYSTTVIGVRA